MKTFNLSWGDRPIQLENENGHTFLRLGAELRVDVTDTSLDQLNRLAQVAADLADVRRDRIRATQVADEVAAEDGYRFVGVPYQRQAAA
ncbi:hypothetical protein EES43_24215 [Streptomyces sp. ADI96-02]|uniref:hypothetical protein n=1 Tax=Streptomyces sp. ADI96-02 TaxID=1522760 RepID=UPI000F55923B|nr:hypothetical protein [Streptomyces sp. ADI96-02]RPK56149.1 hypothetical protein EES43_24215 [Streptomyces sp. ADI96-02]